ncbi:MAG: hypothetical protein LH610_00370 [Sphingomonas bacterium]|nr:hypothetical protein [Sphingomonas bacterium]
MGSGESSFDDDAIRIELRRMVEAFRTKHLDELAAVAVACREEAEASEDQKQRVFSGLEDAKSASEKNIQMMLDFIERR